MGQLRRIQRAALKRAGELVPAPRSVPVDRNVLAAITSVQRAEERLVRVHDPAQEARTYEPRMPKRVAAFGYALLVTFLVAWVLAAVAEVR
jgi:hypothetical protein